MSVRSLAYLFCAYEARNLPLSLWKSLRCTTSPPPCQQPPCEQNHRASAVVDAFTMRQPERYGSGASRCLLFNSHHFDREFGDCLRAHFHNAEFSREVPTSHLFPSQSLGWSSESGLYYRADITRRYFYSKSFVGYRFIDMDIPGQLRENGKRS